MGTSCPYDRHRQSKQYGIQYTNEMTENRVESAGGERPLFVNCRRQFCHGGVRQAGSRTTGRNGARKQLASWVTSGIQAAFPLAQTRPGNPMPRENVNGRLRWFPCPFVSHPTSRHAAASNSERGSSRGPFRSARSHIHQARSVKVLLSMQILNSRDVRNSYSFTIASRLL